MVSIVTTICILTAMFPVWYPGMVVFFPWIAIIIIIILVPVCIFILAINWCFKLNCKCAVIKYNRVTRALLIYTFIWICYTWIITSHVSMACLYHGKNWGNCFFYVMLGNYCPNKDTMWQDYYGHGFSDLS